MGEATERAWAAGFFDGEGHTRVHRSRERSFNLVITVMQTERTTLDRFQAAVGGGSVSGPYGPYDKGATKKPLFMYQANSRKAEAALRALWPYLSAPKRAQASDAVLRVNDHLANSRVHVEPYAIA